MCHRCKKRGHIASVCKSEIHSLVVGDEDELGSTHTIARLKTTKDELKRLEDAKIIEPVSICDWPSPIVLIPKTDGSVRMCGDFKVTINPCISM